MVAIVLKHFQKKYYLLQPSFKMKFLTFENQIHKVFI